MAERVFETLASVNVNGHTEKKEGLTYLSWSYAWDYIKRMYPEASYTIWKNANGLPYVYDEQTGYMVYTSVTIDGITHEMWLPVMDSKNKAMKAHEYQYSTKYGAKTVSAATMFDINKTIMRCLVKNLAMFGLGLYIYAGEDLPQTDEEQPQTAESSPNSTKANNSKGNDANGANISAEDVKKEAELRAKVMAYINRHNMSQEDIKKLCGFYKITSLQNLTTKMCEHYINELEKKGKKINE